MDLVIVCQAGFELTGILLSQLENAKLTGVHHYFQRIRVLSLVARDGVRLTVHLGTAWGAGSPAFTSQGWDHKHMFLTYVSVGMKPRASCGQDSTTEPQTLHNVLK